MKVCFINLTVLLNSLPGFNILQISQLPLQHGKLPRSASSANFNFERTNLHIMSLDYLKSLHQYNNLHLCFCTSSKGLLSEFSFTYTFHISCHFCFVSHSISTSFLFGFPFHFDYRHTWKSPTGLSKIPPSQTTFPYISLQNLVLLLPPIFHHQNPKSY